jgi:translation initiation factor 3 subunit I
VWVLLWLCSERIGTYNGHQGAVYNCDVNFNSTRLLTGSADRDCKLWDVKTGKELFTWSHASGVRACQFAHGERMFLSVQDNTFSQTPTIFIYNLAEDLAQQTKEPVRAMACPGSRINEAVWGALNQTVISAHEDGSLRMWDVETGAEVLKVHDHKKSINSLKLSADGTMLITASGDHTAKLYDAKTLQLQKTYTSDRPLNSAAISSLKEHVIVGGGQDAMNVTTTSSKVGHFEVDFYHTVYAEFLGSVKGHFGPVNAVAFSPTGKSFVSGAEDGYIRLHHFDQEYFKA